MRKLLLGLIFFSLSSVASDYVHNLPNGHFAGHGNWTDNQGNSGSYSTYVELTNNEMRVDYGWDNQSLTIFLSFWFFDAGSFDVIYQGGVAGSGYCEIDQCYYELDANGMRYSETLLFSYDQDGRPTLSKLGQKRIGDREVHWQDGLFYVNLDEEEPIILPVPVSPAP